MIDFNISKSRYIRAVQCKKMYWMDRVKPCEFDNSTVDEAILENGENVGILAVELFQGAVKVQYDTDKQKMMDETLLYIEEGQRYISEASFAYRGRFLSVDILEIVKKDNGIDVNIYEVKSSTSLKDIYIDDVSYQSHVMKKLGYNVLSVNLVILNTDYVREGNLELEKLFMICDVTEKAASREGKVEDMLEFLSQDLDLAVEPDIDIEEHCFAPYPCGYFGYCTKHLPDNNIFTLRNMHRTEKLKIYNRGIYSYEDICSDLPTFSGLKENVREQILGEDVIDVRQIREYIKDFTYPLYYLDFETVQYAIPPYDFSSPYQQLPFQYSLHIDYGNGELIHKEYLAQDGVDCRHELSARLVNDIPMGVVSVAYNMAFEKGIIQKLAFLFPDMRKHLMDIYANMKDLMVPFKNHWFYTREMNGSYSIKYVLPAICPGDPELNYANLEGVKRGDEAMTTFKNMPFMSAQEKEKKRQELLHYCRLDTLAMVKIMERLREY